MTLALAAATPGELRHALAKIAPELAGPEWAGLIPARGAVQAEIRGRDVLLLVTGVGPLSAALEAATALERYRVTGMLNLGVAGSFDTAKAPLCAPVAASEEVCADFGVAGRDGLADASGFPFPQWEGVGGKIFDRLRLDPDEAAKALGLALPPGWTRAPALTSGVVTGGAERAAALAARHATLTESMEGFALALACKARGLPFLEVRTISNAVGERDLKQWKLALALAGLGDVLAGLMPEPGVG
ncbi:futalosine hydrolase [Fundidesulfovibrio soli]|uniref:futalosine hydrolase n=1 Tax=Fundidesulfovibrio soli TaxID=2922716 RepID=UPI001FAF24E6|nr:futalosine hydrolase [Fundidesulfovibrio soli]